MVDQPLSPQRARLRRAGTLSLPPVDSGMVKTKPNDRPIPERKNDPQIMDAGPQPQSDQKLLERIRKRMNRCIQVEAPNRKMAAEDRKFKAGEQWPADVAAQRNTDKRPCLTTNRVKTFVHQVVNAARENRPALIVDPVGDGDKDAAKMMQGIIRHIEVQSKADIAYDTALDDAVTSGWGYMRVVTEWEEEDSLDQTIMIKRVRNPFTVYLDPDCHEPDGSDARFGFVTEIIPTDEFEEEYPKAQLIPFDQGGQGEKYRNWATKDGIRVAEYFEVEREPAKVVSLDSGYVGYEDELDDLVQHRIKRGDIKVLDERDSFRRKVMYYKVTAIEVLERSEWLGKWIPLIPVIGDEIDLEGKVVLSGIIRDAKDPQRMYNYWTTSMTELVALAPKAPYIMTEGQLEGHEQEWKSANTKTNPVLTYKADDVKGHMAPPPQRSEPPPVPAGVMAAMQVAAQDMMATTGIRFDATQQERMADESGRAIRELARKSDVGSFHYIDNLARSMKHLGDQLIDLIPKIYDRRRIMTILRQDRGDAKERVEIDPLAGKALQERKDANGKTIKVFNPGIGRYGVTVEVGPSYATKRQEAAESMLAFVKAMPQTGALISDLIAKNLDWEGADEMAQRLARALPANLLAPEQKDVPPQVQALLQSQKQQIEQLAQHLQQAMKALGEKEADRQVALEKIARDFEAKVLAIVQKDGSAKAKVDAENARTVVEMIDRGIERDHQVDMAEAKPEKKTDA